MREKLPYRPNVCIIAFRDDQFLLVNRVCDEPGEWKFPQGGVDNGEDVISAAQREFLEELGTNTISVVGVSKHTNKYEWPDEQIARYYEKHGNRWRGQKQRFVIARFTGSEDDFTLEKDELRAHKWVSRKEVQAFDEDTEHKHFAHYNHAIRSVLEEFNL